MRCPNCDQRTSGIDSCEWCGYPLLEGRKARRLKAEKLAAKEEAKRKAKEAQEVKLAEKLAQQESKRKAHEMAKRKARQAVKARKEREARQARNEAKIASQLKGLGQLNKTMVTGKQGRKGVDGGDAVVEKDSRATEEALELELTPEIDKGKCLEVYPVNEPYAYIAIEASQPPTYQVYEVGLTKGEEELLKELKLRLYEIINVDLPSVDKPEDFLRQKILEITKDLGISISSLSMEKLMYHVVRDLVGYGRLDPVMRDKQAEDISADGPGIPVFVYHHKYGSLETNVAFNREELDSLVYKLAQRSGRHISVARPLLDASLPSQDRLQLSIGSQVTTRGSTFTIRKFRETPFTPVDLINLGTISVEMAVYFWMAVENGFNILIVGGTASGKTTFLNTISMFIPPNCKVVSIEDTREINLAHQNWIPSVTKETEERGSIEMFDLLRTALRQRPEYLLVGEVRGREASTLFQAMATGHITFCTFHADSVETVVKRLTKPPIDIPLMLLDSIDIVALVNLVKIGDIRTRRCTNVTEVTGVDFDNGTLKTNVVFRLATGNFQFSGESKVFLETMEKLNMSEEELSAEYARRLRIMNLLCENKVNDFYRLSRLLFDYSVRPDEVEKSLLQEKIP
jgi:archaeal flagellar protein FlaI